MDPVQSHPLKVGSKRNSLGVIKPGPASKTNSFSFKRDEERKDKIVRDKVEVIG